MDKGSLIQTMQMHLRQSHDATRQQEDMVL